jgi:hypothetical protein
VVRGHAADAISAVGGFDADLYGERHDTRLIKANEKDLFLIPGMSILPMMRICSSFPAIVMELLIPAGISIFMYGRC